MKVNSVLILAAGKGTRMGELGRKLPKVLWPVYEKSLLELQVCYAKSLAPEAKIFINVFNYKEKIRSFVKEHSSSFENVEILEEDDVLDIGGAIHNLASKLDYQGNLLILNGDQFLMCDKSIIVEGLKDLDQLETLLYSYDVNSSDGYNALDVEGHFLKGIILNKNLSSDKVIQTYTGMSLIKLDTLKPVAGLSKFFDSVANPKLYKVGVKQISELEYWDFGTLDRYLFTIKNVLKNPDSDFYNFLVQEEALLTAKVSGSNYDTKEGFKFHNFLLKEDRIEFEGKVYNL